MLFNHIPTGLSHTFDDERLIADTELILLVKLAQDAGGRGRPAAYPHRHGRQPGRASHVPDRRDARWDRQHRRHEPQPHR